MLYMADAKRLSERWTGCVDARFSRGEAVTGWDGAKRKMKEPEKDVLFGQKAGGDWEISWQLRFQDRSGNN